MTERLFDLEVEEVEVSASRVRFLTGVLAQWTFGDAKPKRHEHDDLARIATDAIRRAQTLKRTEA